MALITYVCILALFSAVVDAKEILQEEVEPDQRQLKPVPPLPIDKSALKRPQQSKSVSPYILEIVPINVAVYQGNNVTLTCTAVNDSNYRIQWWEFAYTPSGGLISNGDEIYSSHPQSDRYSLIKTTPETYDLHIRDVKWEDAGTYLCEDVFSGPPSTYRGAAELIVIEDTPNCTTTLPADGFVIEGQYYTAECSLSFNGAIVPIQTWSGPENFNAGSSEGPNFIWSGVSWVVNRTMDTEIFQCLNNFTNNFVPTSEASSSHVPDWQYAYQTNQMFVYWGPTNMYADPIKQYYYVGEVLTCYADALPPPTYEWLNTRTNEEFPTQEFVITEDLLGTTQQMLCQARNIIQGIVYTGVVYVNVTVIENTTGEGSTSYPVTTPVPVVGACDDLTGRWDSTLDIKASLCITVDNAANGHTIGIFRNHTDTFWIEVVGRTQVDDYEQIGFAGIWPGTVGVSGFVGECHKCNGVETLLVNDIQRTKGAGECGYSGPLHYSPQYTFYRAGPSTSCV